MTEMRRGFERFARAVTAFTASPTATLVAAGLVLCWAITGRAFHYSDTWQLIMNTASSIVTFLMVFVLNFTQKHDTQSINAKLDAIAFGLCEVDSSVVGIENLPEDEAVEKHKQALTAND